MKDPMAFLEKRTVYKFSCRNVFVFNNHVVGDS